jgi:GntR family transcriptional repressor for pyruvate dehydrogenase complex
VDKKLSFRLLQPVRLSDGAVEQIHEMIIKGELLPGDKLPSERDLTTQLGVSRTAVRDALRILEGMGLLSVQPGRGTFVVDGVDEVTSAYRWVEWLARHKDQIIQIMEVRECLEVRAAELAAERVTPSEIDAMEQALDQMEECIDRDDIDSLVEADRTFHDLLCQASRNELIPILRRSLYLTLQGRMQTLFRITPRARESLAEHRVVLKAMRAREPEGAAQAVRDHLRKVTEAYLKTSELENVPLKTERAK